MPNKLNIKILAILIIATVATVSGIGIYLATQQSTPNSLQDYAITEPSSGPNNLNNATINAYNSTIIADNNTTIIEPTTSPTVEPTPTPAPETTLTYTEISNMYKADQALCEITVKFYNPTTQPIDTIVHCNWQLVQLHIDSQSSANAVFQFYNVQSTITGYTIKADGFQVRVT
jgi:hypothetical protein